MNRLLRFAAAQCGYAVVASVVLLTAFLVMRRCFTHKEKDDAPENGDEE